MWYIPVHYKNWYTFNSMLVPLRHPPWFCNGFRVSGIKFTRHHALSNNTILMVFCASISLCGIFSLNFAYNSLNRHSNTFTTNDLWEKRKLWFAMQHELHLFWNGICFNLNLPLIQFGSEFKLWKINLIFIFNLQLLDYVNIGMKHHKEPYNENPP